jgi:hypothetical protein
MSASGIISQSNGKIFDILLPNPYPYPAQPPTLAQVLATNPNGDDAGNQNIANLLQLETTNVVQQDQIGGHLTIGGTPSNPGSGGDLRIQGATLKGSILAGDGTSTVGLPVGANGLVLKANSATATGLEWGTDASGGTVIAVNAGVNIDISGTIAQPIVNLQNPLTATLNMGSVALTDKNGATGGAGQFLSAGTGGETEWANLPAFPVNSVSAGTNISLTGTSTDPIINLQNPLTATLNLGSQNMTAGDPATQTNSTTNNGGVSYNASATVGGGILATYLANQAQISDLTLQENIFITPAQIILNNQSVGTQLVSNTITETDIEIEDVNGTSGAVERATLTKNSLAYVNQDATIPTLSNTSTYDNCSRTAVSVNVATGEQATRTEIVDKLLQSRQVQTLVQPSSSITSTINSNCEIIASVPQAYIQAITDNTSSLSTGAFGVSAQENTAELGVSYNNTNPGNEYQGQGNIITNGAGSSMTLTSANIAGASSHLLRLEVPLVGDALIEHQVVGVGVRNLDITTPGQFSVVAGSASGFSIGTPAGAFQTAIAGNASGSLIASGVNHLFRTTSNTSTATTPSFNFQSEGASTASYPAIKLDRPVPASGTGETIGTIGMWADDASNVSREYVRLQAKTENVSPGNVDGTLSVLTIINSGASPTEIFNFNGGQNEINTFRPFDLNGNALRTSQGDMSISTSASAGNGVLTLATKDGTGGLSITGDKTQSATAGGSAGTHLVITLNGVVYKIALLNP